MKSAVVDYRYKTFCLRIVPRYGSGTPIRLTSHPRDIATAGGTYKADRGYSFTGYTAGASGAAGILDLEGILQDGLVTRDALASGVYDMATIYAFATLWTAPVEDEEPLAKCWMGKTERRDDRWQAEILTAEDALGQAVTASYTAKCQKKFGGTEYGGCQKPLGPITVTGTLTSVTSRSAFADSARAESADYFTAGLVSFTSGANAGLKAQEIKAHASGGALTLMEPFYYLPEVGDAYTLIPGCRQRLADCIAWGNVARFGGFAHVPTQTQYTGTGE